MKMYYHNTEMESISQALHQNRIRLAEIKSNCEM